MVGGRPLQRSRSLRAFSLTEALSERQRMDRSLTLPPSAGVRPSHMAGRARHKHSAENAPPETPPNVRANMMTSSVYHDAPNSAPCKSHAVATRGTSGPPVQVSNNHQHPSYLIGTSNSPQQPLGKVPYSAPPAHSRGPISNGHVSEHVKRKLEWGENSAGAVHLSSKTDDPIADLSNQDSGVKVILRVRPMNKRELLGGAERLVTQESKCSLSVNDQMYTFDYVYGEDSNQGQVFQGVGKTIVDICLSGLNSSIFAYGQTGSGKTYTMMGKTHDAATGLPSDHRGLTPRVFEHMFSRIREEEVLNSAKQLKYTCKCSFLEIYNEQITDLLEPSMKHLLIREDIRSGVYVENLSEEPVNCVDDVTRLITKGTANRKVASTAMNSESSRSHSVFTCVIQSQSKSITEGISSTRHSRLNLVDLAGSERQKLTGASGDRLKEAANINRSLTQLGIVIKLLAEAAQSGKQRHIPYRDSRLTFLLQESLGGNAKMVMICALSPSSLCINETVSTIKFAQRVKFVQNKAVINEEMSSDVNVLREQIRRLKEELTRVRNNSQLNGLDLANLLPLPPGVTVNSVALALPALESKQAAAAVAARTGGDGGGGGKGGGEGDDRPFSAAAHDSPDVYSDDEGDENIWRKEGHRGYDSDTAAESNCSLSYRFVNEYASWAESRRLSIKPRGSVDASRAYVVADAKGEKEMAGEKERGKSPFGVVVERGDADEPRRNDDEQAHSPAGLSPDTSECGSRHDADVPGSDTTSDPETLSDSSMEAELVSPDSILSPTTTMKCHVAEKAVDVIGLAATKAVRATPRGGDDESVEETERRNIEDLERELLDLRERIALRSAGAPNSLPPPPRGTERIGHSIRHDWEGDEAEANWEWAEGKPLAVTIVPEIEDEVDPADMAESLHQQRKKMSDGQHQRYGRHVRKSSSNNFETAMAATVPGGTKSRIASAAGEGGGVKGMELVAHASCWEDAAIAEASLEHGARTMDLVSCPEESDLIIGVDGASHVSGQPPTYVLSADIARAIDPLRRSGWERGERRLSKGKGGGAGTTTVRMTGSEGDRFRKMWRSTTALEHAKGGAGSLQLVACVDGPEGFDQTESHNDVMQAIVGGALRRERAAEEVVQQMAGEIEQLNRLVRQYKHERECNQVLMQAREDKIRRLEDVVDGVISADTFVGQEFSALVYEQKILQEKVDHHPEITRSGIEQQRMIEELRQYREFYEEGERDRLLEEMRHLRTQVLSLMDSKMPAVHGSVGGVTGGSRGAAVVSISDQSTGSVHRSQSTRVRSRGDDLAVVTRGTSVDQRRADDEDESASRVREELEARLADVESELEETRIKADELHNELEFYRQELEVERERSEEAQERFDVLMDGHARLINSFSELQEENLKLIDRQRAIKRGIEDLKKKASLMGPHSTEARWLDIHAAELAAVQIEGNCAKSEVESLRAQLTESAEAVQAAGELLSRLKEAEDATVTAQDEAAIAEQMAEELRREMDKMSRRHATEMATVEQRLRESRFRKAGICQMCQMADRVTYAFPEADAEAALAAAEEEENRQRERSMGTAEGGGGGGGEGDNDKDDRDGLSDMFSGLGAAMKLGRNLSIASAGSLTKMIDSVKNAKGRSYGVNGRMMSRTLEEWSWR